MADTVLHRHDLVRIDPVAWTALLANHPELTAIGPAVGWAAAGRPLVVRRRTMADPDGQVALGLPLPPCHGRHRISVAIDPGAILSVDGPPTLRMVSSSAPPHWIPTIDALLRLGDTSGIGPRVFGSLAWAALTGLDYLRPDSDLDLLWPIDPGCDTSGLLDGLRRIEAAAPMRLDGEVVDREGWGVNWRELASGSADILVKGLDAVELMPTRRFIRARVST